HDRGRNGQRFGTRGLCANEGSAATSDSQKIITAAGCLLWAVLPKRQGRVATWPVPFCGSHVCNVPKHMRLIVRHLFIFSFPAKEREWNYTARHWHSPTLPPWRLLARQLRFPLSRSRVLSRRAKWSK